MQVDWFTLVAQLANFVVLLLLLRRFLYGPITRVMAERQVRVTAQLSEAEAREREADRALLELEEKLQAAEHTRQAALEQAYDEAEATRRDLITAAQTEVEVARRQWYDALSQEKESFLQALQLRMTEELYQTLRQILKDLADETLEAQLVRALLTRLQSLDGPERATFTRALRQTGGDLVVASTLPLSETLQTELKAGVEGVFGESVTLTFQRDADLVCGVALLAHDQKLGWTLADYVSELEAAVLKYLAATPEPEPVLS